MFAIFFCKFSKCLKSCNTLYQLACFTVDGVMHFGEAEGRAKYISKYCQVTIQCPYWAMCQHGGKI